ncbi:DUF2812 domain-containing protein [Sinanaerobacter sp. ZZT-01]|uniref:DUF2812 domain-containing protein n=1 Tax=Sinanaerobacter sp. ZZT-01 TaxID=3111540 RepID=UPI002D79E187|nr:DUF2812 domain-containing protein [Sinanaerobacter sp. ZZT-01]WRR93544.1 DUF2812 domain-containing protein [Sinanaerobacter sp. ZZT-01]
MWKDKKKRKEKVTYRLRPNDVYQIGEHESWFRDMAKQGAHLEKMGVRFARFRKGKPEKMQYRVELFPGIEDPLGQQQKDFYKKYGWEFVTKYGKFCVYRSRDDENAPELHTDMEEQAHTIKELEKSLRGLTFFVLAMIVLIMVMILWMWMFSNTLILDFVEGNAVQQMLVFALEIYVGATSLRSWFSIRRLIDDLKSGHPINHYAPWKKRRYINFIITAFFILLIGGGALLIPGMQVTQVTERNLPTVTDNSLPIIRLSEIEQDVRLERLEDSDTSDEVDWQNYYRSEWALLADQKYESSEHGIIYEENWKDGSGIYSPTVHSKVIFLRSQKLAKPLAKELLAYYGRPKELAYEKERFETRKDGRFDFLSIHVSDASLQVCAVKNNKVIFLSYYGYAKPETVIDAIAKKFKNT